MSTNHKIFVLIVLGLIARLLLAFLPGFSIDMNDWFAWSIRLSNFNFVQFYSKDVFTDYTPGYLYILSLFGSLKSLLALPNNYFYLLLKLPAITADLIIGLFIYREAKKNISPKLALFTSSLFLFNPALIFNSAVWGQVDSVLTLMMLIAVILLRNNNLILSSFFFGLALLVKLQALALLPILVIFLVNHLKLSNVFKIALPSLLIIFTLTIPFFPHQTLINLIQHILATANEYPYTSVNAYNFWGVIGFWATDTQLWTGLSYQYWGYILLLIYWSIASYLYFRKKVSIYSFATLVTLGFFFLPTRVHERYLYPAVVFLILSSMFLKSRLLLMLTIILSLIHFLNLYYVYIYYNEIYLKLPRILYNSIIYNFIAENSKNLSIVSAIIFILISAIIVKYDQSSKNN